jgi:hypothetical protein
MTAQFVPAASHPQPILSVVIIVKNVIDLACVLLVIVI